jgi:hypothetical protein
MPILRLAYATQFLIALIAVFILWSEVGGQGHLDLMPWYAKAALGAGAAFATVKATAAAVSEKQAWNRRTRKWCGILLALLVACGLATYYCHLYLETDEDDQGGGDDSALLRRPVTRGAPSWQAEAPAPPTGSSRCGWQPGWPG